MDKRLLGQALKFKDHTHTPYKLKRYINQHGYRTLFITPDPVYPDPMIAMYCMFGNSSDENGGLEIAQMNII